MATHTSSRHNIDTGTPWEGIVGYSRAVRMGNMIFVTGTIAADETGAIVGGNDPYAQTVAAIRKSLADIHRYPDGGCFYLRNKLARALNVSPV